MLCARRGVAVANKREYLNKRKRSQMFAESYKRPKVEKNDIEDLRVMAYGTGTALNSMPDHFTYYPGTSTTLFVARSATAPRPA